MLGSLGGIPGHLPLGAAAFPLDTGWTCRRLGPGHPSAIWHCLPLPPESGPAAAGGTSSDQFAALVPLICDGLVQTGESGAQKPLLQLFPSLCWLRMKR